MLTFSTSLLAAVTFLGTLGIVNYSLIDTLANRCTFPYVIIGSILLIMNAYHKEAIIIILMFPASTRITMIMIDLLKNINVAAVTIFNSRKIFSKRSV